MNLPTRKSLLVYLIVIGLTFIFLTPFCGFVYKCGCTYLWSGGMRQCNVFNDSGPKCPWCVAGQSAIIGMVPVAIIIGGGGMTLYWLQQRIDSAMILLGLGVAAFALWAFAAAWLFKWLYRYPYFL